MINVESIDDVFPAIDELITGLKASSQTQLAAILHHRVHIVAWTTRTELFDELNAVLRTALDSDGVLISPPLKDQIERVLTMIKPHLS